jgi:hypothetical protein
MRSVIVGLAAIVMSAPPANDSCIVLQIDPIPVSSSVLRISTVVHGEPQEGSVVQVFNGNRNQDQTLVSDVDGVVAASALPPGTWFVTALTSEGRVAGLALNIPREVESSPVADVTLDLDKGYWKQPKKKPEETETMSAFRGRVVDETGSGLQWSVIAVYDRNSAIKRPIAVIHPKSHTGEFSAELQAGTYTAVFSNDDSQSKVVPIEISKTAEKKDLVVILRANSC